VIELPVISFKKKKLNVLNYSKQIRVVQEIESGIYFRVASTVFECWVTEINPKSAKVLATNDGDADKAQMVQASPFRDTVKYRVNKAAREALADAWAIGLGAWGVRGDRVNYTKMMVATIVQV
jgi:hypothetical protein